MIDAYANFSRLWRLELHAYERPHAAHMQLVANANRDKKKQKAYSMDQFYLYQPTESKNLPEAQYGAAAAELIKLNLFPSWALFCYKDLVSRAGRRPPELLCFKCDTAILIAPEPVEGGYKGLLIALEEASGALLQMESPCGQKVKLSVPYIPTKVIAKEDVILPIEL